MAFLEFQYGPGDVVVVEGARIPVDFMIMDTGPDTGQSERILGRPFLATAGAIIDARAGTLSLEEESTSKLSSLYSKEELRNVFPRKKIEELCSTTLETAELSLPTKEKEQLLHSTTSEEIQTNALAPPASLSSDSTKTDLLLHWQVSLAFF